MLASKMLKDYGDALIGKIIHTEKYRDWPAQLCIITEVNPDPNAPEISFLVKSLNPFSPFLNKEIGVFEWEEVEFPNR